MVFENLTVLEFHLHTGDEAEDEPTQVVRRPPEEPSKGTGRGRRAALIGLGLAIVSVAISVGVTLAVRRFRAGRGDTEEEEQPDAVVEIEH